MQGSGGAATPEKTSFAKRYFDADGSSRCHCHLCSVSLIGQSEVLRLKGSKDPKSMGLQRQLCLREDHDRHVF